jgi:hypothetical protein
MNNLNERHYKKAFSADKAILKPPLLACALRLLFYVPHNDDQSIEVCKW